MTPLGVGNSQVISNKYSIYPNPNNGIFYVKSPEFIKGTSEIRIYDASGKKIYQSLITNFSISEIDLTGNPSGVYIISITDDSGIKNMRVVKQ